MIGVVHCKGCHRLLRVSDAWLSVVCPYCEHLTRYAARDVWAVPNEVTRGSSEVEQQAHNLTVVGSIPIPATKC